MQRKQGFRESFKDYMIDMQTMVRPLNYSSKDTLRIIKENCTPSLRIFLRAYKVSDLDTPMILADEYEELEKEREAFTQDQVGITNVEYTSGAANAANRREMASDLSRREASGGREMLPLQTNGQADRGGAAVVPIGDDWWRHVHPLQGYKNHKIRVMT